MMRVSMVEIQRRRLVWFSLILLAGSLETASAFLGAARSGRTWVSLPLKNKVAESLTTRQQAKSGDGFEYEQVADDRPWDNEEEWPIERQVLLSNFNWIDEAVKTSSVVAAVVAVAALLFSSSPADAATATVAAPPASKATTTTVAGAPSSAKSAVTISALNYNGKVETTEADEYIELANTGASPIDLSGWKVTTETNNQAFAFPSGASKLAAGKSVRVYTNEKHPESGGYSFASSKAIWNNKGSIAHVSDASGKEVASFAYGSFKNVAAKTVASKK